jgi:hypothetical protein
MEIIFEAIQGCKTLGAYCQMHSKEQINAQELWSFVQNLLLGRSNLEADLSLPVY